MLLHTSWRRNPVPMGRRVQPTPTNAAADSVLMRDGTMLRWAVVPNDNRTRRTLALLKMRGGNAMNTMPGFTGEASLRQAGRRSCAARVGNAARGNRRYENGPDLNVVKVATIVTIDGVPLGDPGFGTGSPGSATFFGSEVLGGGAGGSGGTSTGGTHLTICGPCKGIRGQWEGALGIKNCRVMFCINGACETEQTWIEDCFVHYVSTGA